MFKLIRHALSMIGLSLIKGLYNTPSAERDRIIRLAFKYVGDERVYGDYFEFGVYKGRTFTYAFHAINREKHNCLLYAFDSFKGFPEPDNIDKVFERFKEGEASSGQEYFMRYLRKHKVDINLVTVVPGWFDDTLTQQTREKLGLKRASVIYIDCDMHKSTVPVLAFIRPLLQDGTVLLFDDWFCYRADPGKGQRRAVSEWLERFPEITLIEWRKFAIVGQSFIVNIKGHIQGNGDDG